MPAPIIRPDKLATEGSITAKRLSAHDSRRHPARFASPPGKICVAAHQKDAPADGGRCIWLLLLICIPRPVAYGEPSLRIEQAAEIVFEPEMICAGRNPEPTVPQLAVMVTVTSVPMDVPLIVEGLVVSL